MKNPTILERKPLYKIATLSQNLFMISLWIPESIIPIDDKVFLEICRKNPDNRIERTKKGEILLMAPTGGETGKWNFELNYFF